MVVMLALLLGGVLRRSGDVDGWCCWTLLVEFWFDDETELPPVFCRIHHLRLA